MGSVWTHTPRMCGVCGVFLGSPESVGEDSKEKIKVDATVLKKKKKSKPTTPELPTSPVCLRCVTPDFRGWGRPIP